VKEQAERKRFAMALPKAERTCLNALEQWEKDHVNEQFLINDIPIRQILEQQHPMPSNITTTTISKTVDQKKKIFNLIFHYHLFRYQCHRLVRLLYLNVKIIFEKNLFEM